MKFKRFLAAFLIAASALTALAGCQHAPDGSADTTAPTGTSASTEKETTASTQSSGQEDAETTPETTADTEPETQPGESETQAPEDDMTEMDARLNELLRNKTQLRFDENGQFKIMILADLHIPSGGLSRSIMNNVKTMVEREDPDFVILTGDNVVADIWTEKIFKRTLDGLAEYFEEKGIYWMHVFGNHDGEMAMSKEDQQAVYESYDYCLSKDTDKELSGVGNYVIPLYGSNSDEVKFVLWGLDSGDYLSPEEQAALYPAGATSFGGYTGTNYAFIQQDQIEWYKETSELLQANNNGELVPGLMAFHIPLQESYTAWLNRETLEWEGERNEAVCSSAHNSGLFEVLRARGDVKAIINGHDHVNNYMVNYGGIKLCYAGTLTNTTYHDEAKWGTRVFVINESNPSDVQTYLNYLDESLNVKPEDALPALSGVVEDFEGEAPQFTISGFNGASDNGGKAEIVADKGVNGSNALAVSRTTWSGKSNVEVIWDMDAVGSVGENKYLVVWMDLSANDVDFRKAGFGLLANNLNSSPYRTDDFDSPSPFYYKAEGSDEWIAMSTGGDGCFGVEQDSSVKGFKGWFAFPLENMLRGVLSLKPQTTITGLYFYMSPSSESEINKPVYLDEMQLVVDFTPVG